MSVKTVLAKPAQARRGLLLVGLSLVLCVALAAGVRRAFPPESARAPAESSFLEQMGAIVTPLAAEAEAVRNSDLPEAEKERRWAEIRRRRALGVGELYRAHGRTPPPGH
jgi:hypothetical protein